MTGTTRSVAILLFDGIETLDFCGPLEVFSVAGKPEKTSWFEVFTVAAASPVATSNGLSVNPARRLDDCPHADILVVPGGIGTRREMANPDLLAWIRSRAASAELVLSVCTGALILGAAGLLAGLKATTHASALDLLRATAPDAEVVDSVKYVDNGRIILSAGISAGIDASLHAVGRLVGQDTARSTARHMEYDWREEEGKPGAGKPPL
jgi:transcriptional regulator GlxA family with amidase domain